jgi:hypothetical protein
MMIPGSHEKGVRVDRKDLLEKIKANRATHKDTFEKAMVGYRKRAIEELDRSLADARAGKRIRATLELIEPMNQTAEYDMVIAMLEMCVDKEVVIATGEFQQYVLDQWHWKAQFETSNAAYLNE